jgi:hypothetical protein
MLLDLASLVQASKMSGCPLHTSAFRQMSENEMTWVFTTCAAFVGSLGKEGVGLD